MISRTHTPLAPPRIVQGFAHTFGWLRINGNTWEKPNGDRVRFPYSREPIITCLVTLPSIKDTKTQR